MGLLVLVAATMLLNGMVLLVLAWRAYPHYRGPSVTGRVRLKCMGSSGHFYLVDYSVAGEAGSFWDFRMHLMPQVNKDEEVQVVPYGPLRQAVGTGIRIWLAQVFSPGPYIDNNPRRSHIRWGGVFCALAVILSTIYGVWFYYYS